ncbi:hypothetical protein ACJJTC_002861 [Scirpophaga incertulas]
MNKEIKKQLIKSVDSIKNKLKEIQSEEDAANLKFKKVFKPITDNLETMISGSDKDKATLNVSIDMSNRQIEDDRDSSLDYKDIGKNAQTYANEISEYYDDTDDDRNPYNKINDTLKSLDKDDIVEIYNNNNINVPFGVRSENKNLMIGNSKVTFSSTSDTSQNRNYIVSIGDRHYELTPGLKELLMCNRPNLKIVNEKDKITYKYILHCTNVHKRNFDPNSQMKGDKGSKYREIIKPLFTEPNKHQADIQLELNTEQSVFELQTSDNEPVNTSSSDDCNGHLHSSDHLFPYLMPLRYSSINTEILTHDATMFPNEKDDQQDLQSFLRSWSVQYIKCSLITTIKVLKIAIY